MFNYSLLPKLLEHGHPEWSHVFLPSLDSVGEEGTLEHPA